VVNIQRMMVCKGKFCFFETQLLEGREIGCPVYRTFIEMYFVRV